jgi:hypothetical protein
VPHHVFAEVLEREATAWPFHIHSDLGDSTPDCRGALAGPPPLDNAEEVARGPLDSASSNAPTRFLRTTSTFAM